MRTKGAEKRGWGFTSLLALVFAAVWVFGAANRSWIWVFCPVWISAWFFLCVFLTILLGGRIKRGGGEQKSMLWAESEKCRQNKLVFDLRAVEWRKRPKP